MGIIRESTIEQTVGRANWIGGVLAGGAALVSGVSSILASDRASDAAGDAADASVQAQLDMYYQSREDTAPWRAAGESALNALYGEGFVQTGRINDLVQERDNLQIQLDDQRRSPQNAVNAGQIERDIGLLNAEIAQLGGPAPPAPAAPAVDQQTIAQLQKLEGGGTISNANRASEREALNYFNQGVTAEELLNPPAQAPQPPPAAPATAGDGLLAGPTEPYDGQTPTNLLNQGFTPTGNAVTPGEWLEQNPFQYSGPDSSAMINEGFQYSGSTTPAQLADQGFQYSGPNPTNALNNLLAWKRDPFVFEEDPGYQFRLGEGQQAIDRAQAARGNFFSGAALKEANRYNQGFASNEYNTAWQRHTTEQEMDLRSLAQKYNANSADYNREAAAYMDKYNMTADAYNREFGQYVAQAGLAMDDRSRRFGEHTASYGMNQGAYNNDWGQYMDQYNMRNQDYQNYYGRYLDKVNMYLGLSGSGQQVASQTANNALATGINVGNTQAAGIMNQGNAESAGILGVGNALNQGIGNYLSYNLWNQNAGGNLTPSNNLSGRGTTQPINYSFLNS